MVPDWDVRRLAGCTSHPQIGAGYHKGTKPYRHPRLGLWSHCRGGGDDRGARSFVECDGDVRIKGRKTMDSQFDSITPEQKLHALTAELRTPLEIIRGLTEMIRINIGSNRIEPEGTLRAINSI